jgi:hypothetical protein
VREPGKPFPTRKELGDTDESEWPIFNGAPSDPWMIQIEVLMTERETGAPVILRAKSWSARDIITDVCRMVTFQRRQRGPNAKPIIAIGAASRPHPRGSYKVPVFTINDWVGADAVPEPAPSELAKDVSEHLQVRSIMSGTEKTTTPRSRRRSKKASSSSEDDNDLDDALPW